MITHASTIAHAHNYPNPQLLPSEGTIGGTVNDVGIFNGFPSDISP